jgi:hypothetical protein
VEDAPLALVEHSEPGLEHRPILRELVLVLLGADRLQRVDLLVVAHRRPGRERQRAVGPSALERLQHLFLLHVCRLRQLGDRRRALELHGQLLDQSRELHIQLLEAARDPHRPAAVAEVALDLADDVRSRVGRQLDATVEVEPVDRLDQSDRTDLDQVVELLAAIRVAPCQRSHQRHVPLDQLLARCDVAVVVIGA